MNEIYEKFFFEQTHIPNLAHTIGNGVISDGNDIVAFGMVKLYPEAIIVIDQDASARNKATALKLLFDEAVLACKAREFTDLKASVFSDSYGNLLAKHFNFKYLDGKLMQVNLGE